MMNFFISNGQKLRSLGQIKYYPFGDSITAYVDSWAYTSRAKDKYGLTRTMLAVGGEGFPRMSKQVNQLFTGDGICSTACGRNDYLQANRGNMGLWVTTLMLGVQFSDTITAASAATKSGSWSSVDYTAYCSKRNDCQQSSGAGAYLDFAVTGKHHVVAMLGSESNVSQGIFRIYGDGVLLYTIDTSSNCYTDTLGGTNYQEVGLGFTVFFNTTGAHTIRVEVVSGTVTCDYVSTLKAPADCNPAIVMTEIATAAATESTDLRNNLRALVAKYKSRGFPVNFTRINNYWTDDSVQNPGPDLVHPDEFGHQCMATAIYTNLQ